MSDTLHATPSATEHLAGDYLRTFARFLDPNLPARSLVSSQVQSDDLARWPLGQTLAFATVGSLGLWGLVAAMVYYLA